MKRERRATNPIENQELSARQALIAHYQFLDGFNSVRNRKPRAKRQRVELTDARCVELARMPSLGLAEWIELTGMGLGEHNRFSIGFDGVGFTKSEQDDIGEESLEWQEYMLRDNEHEVLAFPCTPTRLLEFIASELCRELAGFSAPCAFQEAVAQNVHATGAETPNIDSEKICSKERREGVQSTSVIVTIGGREAIPVRAIPYAAGWEVSPDILSASLAHTAEGIRLANLFAYQLQTDGTFAPILAKEWDSVDDRLRALSASLQAKNSDRMITRPEWLSGSIPLLPAGVFVWKDDLEKAFWRQFSPNSPVGVTYLEGARPGDGEMNFAPMIPAELRQQVSEGFVLGEIEQAPANSLKEPLSNLPSQKRDVAEQHLRNRPTTDSNDSQTDVTSDVTTSCATCCPRSEIAVGIQAEQITHHKKQSNEKRWDYAKRKELWIESLAHGMTQMRLGEKHGVSRQRISKLLKDAKKESNENICSAKSLSMVAQITGTARRVIGSKY